MDVSEPVANAGSPPSGNLDNANLNGRYNSQVKKQQMLMGNFAPSTMWNHDGAPHRKPLNHGSP